MKITYNPMVASFPCYHKDDDVFQSYNHQIYANLIERISIYSRSWYKNSIQQASKQMLWSLLLVVS